MKKIISTLALLSLAFTLASSGHLVNQGELIGAIALQDGGAITIAMEGKVLNLSYADLYGYTQEGKVILEDSAPAQMVMSACGVFVQVFVNYDDATIRRYIWELPAGVYVPCTADKTLIYIPMAVR